MIRVKIIQRPGALSKADVGGYARQTPSGKIVNVRSYVNRHEPEATKKPKSPAKPVGGDQVNNPGSRGGRIIGWRPDGSPIYAGQDDQKKPHAEIASHRDHLEHTLRHGRATIIYAAKRDGKHDAKAHEKIHRDLIEGGHAFTQVNHDEKTGDYTANHHHQGKHSNPKFLVFHGKNSDPSAHTKVRDIADKHGQAHVVHIANGTATHHHKRDGKWSAGESSRIDHRGGDKESHFRVKSEVKKSLTRIVAHRRRDL